MYNCYMDFNIVDYESLGAAKHGQAIRTGFIKGFV